MLLFVFASWLQEVVPVVGLRLHHHHHRFLHLAQVLAHPQI